MARKKNKINNYINLKFHTAISGGNWSKRNSLIYRHLRRNLLEMRLFSTFSSSVILLQVMWLSVTLTQFPVWRSLHETTPSLHDVGRRVTSVSRAFAGRDSRGRKRSARLSVSCVDLLAETLIKSEWHQVIRLRTSKWGKSLLTWYKFMFNQSIKDLFNFELVDMLCFYSQTKWSVPLKIAALMNWLFETWTH